MENNENQDYIIIKSYAKTWKIENRIYAIFNFVLPFPVAPREVLYFAVSALVIYVLSQIIPPLTAIPALIRYPVFSALLARVISKQKLDGMNPVKFFGVFIVHLLTKGLFIERFKSYSPRQDSKIKIEWWCSRVKMSDRLCKR
jgi:hypothetical protein